MRVDVDRLRDELDTALTLSMDGSPMGAGLAGRLRSQARMILLRHGLAGARVLVEPDGNNVRVRVLLPPQAAQVRELKLSIGGV